MAMEISTTMIAITTISSMKVKPKLRPKLPLVFQESLRASGWRNLASNGPSEPRPSGSGRRVPGLTPLSAQALLPLRIRSAIGGLFVGFAIDVEYVLSAPAGRIGIVLVAAQAPVGGAGERIARNAAQQADFLIFGAIGHFHAIHQHLKRFRVSVGTLLDGAEHIGVGQVFVLVDGMANFVQRVAQRALSLGTYARPRQRHRHGSENQHDREGYDQLHQREAALVPAAGLLASSSWPVALQNAHTPI